MHDDVFRRLQGVQSASLVVGKFDPPHAGHDFMIRLAESYGKPLIIAVMPGKDTFLPHQCRVNIMKMFYPRATVFIPNVSHGFVGIVGILKDINYGAPTVRSLHVVAGTDRKDDYTRIFQKYNDGHTFYFPNGINFKEAVRPPHATSSTLMRQCVVTNNRSFFLQRCPPHMLNSDRERLWDDMRLLRNLDA